MCNSPPLDRKSKLLLAEAKHSVTGQLTLCCGGIYGDTLFQIWNQVLGQSLRHQLIRIRC